MKKPDYNDYFPLEEYESRIKRIRNACAEAGLDALLLTTQPNVDYSSGFLHGTWSPSFGEGKTQVLITAEEDEPVLFAQAGLQALFSTSAIGDIRPQGDANYGTGPNAVYDVFKEKGLLYAKVGIEMSKEDLMGLSYPLFSAMKELMPKASFSDCSEIMYSVREIKSFLEIEKIKKAVRITEKAYEYAIPQIKEGMSERELASLIARGMAMYSDEGGARNPWFIFVYTDGKNPAAWDGIPSSYRFKKGDCIYIDCGATYHGYYSDFIRIASIGEPSEDKQRIYYGARNANMALIKSLKPGMKVSTMCEILAQELGKQGLGTEVQLMQEFGGMYEGHGIGLSIHEPPVIKADSDSALREGMTLAIEGNVFDNLPLSRTRIALKNEENVLITKDGCDLLTTMPNDIYISNK